MLKIGLLGAGHLGKIHLKCIKQIDDIELVGFYDTNEETRKAVEEEFDVKAYGTIEDLMDVVDAVDIVTPTVSHFNCAKTAIENNKHVFIEKPIATSPEEARELIELASNKNIKVQVGHVERFNPAFISAKDMISEPKFIESHRLALFNPRGTDVPVVLDLMIHDIDIVLCALESNVKKVSASGVNVVSDTPDIANARLEFENGAVANLTASRISLKNMRKTRIFQRDAYISIDFLDKKSEVVRMEELDGEPDDPMAMVLDLGPDKKKRRIYFDKPEVANLNAIVEELKSFNLSIINDSIPTVTIEDGYNALNVAHMIMEDIERNSQK
ncbi:MAG: Gfo/Idh/MocA family oxidoreductase [Lentimicrobiaceae bacterium]|jgi:predicted dehydrogenase|nr:Gfo/Idh/MocA family oxidoreductase [Lentimicrobiaceae bacterium]MCP4910882.1 Gfo/Idh/MocA family oxidoreductase [Bacteroidota bacterium]MBT3453748.1 Gfo/Idh/MocA family oxidoreductase [Lentimicrobiaceae bacterium]MBT3819527.1 Gfo/Idh/MocA family oxidoreductase [Lentimicrobiaceae bacterium]MBT4061668.1 Gfo/Idh/MocA family oxidoreductase [Lentimicrobiaceae bacterium]